VRWLAAGVLGLVAWDVVQQGRATERSWRIVHQSYAAVIQAAATAEGPDLAARPRLRLILPWGRVVTLR
jgi:hypothetical protein